MAQITEEQAKELIGEAVEVLKAEVQKEFAQVNEKLDAVQASIQLFINPRSEMMIPMLGNSTALEGKFQENKNDNPSPAVTSNSKPVQRVIKAPYVPEDDHAGELKAAFEKLQNAIRMDLSAIFASEMKTSRGLSFGRRGSCTKCSLKRSCKSSDSDNAALKQKELINNYKWPRVFGSFGDGVCQAVKVVGMVATIVGTIALWRAIFDRPASRSA